MANRIAVRGGRGTWRFALAATALGAAGAAAGCPKPPEPPLPECGNGVLEGDEACDDFNPFDGDGCSSSCMLETPGPVCGDGVVEPPEVCDDANNVGGDACAGDCLSGTGFDTSCSGMPGPVSASDPIDVSGSVGDPAGAPIDGALVEVVRASDGVTLAMGSTDPSGAFAVPYPTGGAVFDAFLRATAAGLLPTMLYLPRPPNQDWGAGLVMTDAATHDLFAAAAGVTADPAFGTLLVTVLDCGFARVEGATVASAPAAAGILYLDESFQPAPALSATSASAAAVLFNLPPGDVDVTIDASGFTWAPRIVPVVADAITFSDRMP